MSSPAAHDAAATAPPPRSLAALRSAIDAVDVQLVALLNERSRLVMEVGQRKALDGTPVYAPHREQAVLARVLAMNPGPTLSTTIEAVYREIMSGSFALERPLRIGYLGPAGSYSHDAAVKQFGASVSYENLRLIEGVFEEVSRGNVDYGLVPIENTIIGPVAETLDAWLSHAHGVAVCAEVALSVAHALVVCPGTRPSDVREVRSKPEALAQCRHWLATQYPAAALVPYPSSSAAVASLAAALAAPGGEEGARHLAAVASPLAARLHALPCLFTDIQDASPNTTRFLVLCSRRSPAATMGAPSGQDKTSALLVLGDAPGALCSVLDAFRSAGINLTHIDKRTCSAAQLAWLQSVADYGAAEGGGGEGGGGAGEGAAAAAAAAAAASARAGLAPSLFVASSGGGRGGAPLALNFVFFIECEGHVSEPGVASAMAEAGRRSRLLKVLGSFPRARRVL
jgi:chorismate mutase/prephenate dehydratase